MTSGFRYNSPENYHLTYSDAARARQRLTAETVAVCFFILVLFPAALWLFSFTDYPGSQYRGRGGLTRLMFLLPVYIRLPLAALVIVGSAAAMIAYVVRLRDRRQDFLFGPDGVAHIGLFVSKSLLWSDIDTLNLVHHQRRILFFKKRFHAYHVAKFIPKKTHSATVRARSKFAALLSIVQTSTIVINLDAFDMPAEQFEDAMLFLHPRLEITREHRVRWN